MTTSPNKARGSAAEREVARLLGGVRVGMDGGPVDVIVVGYANVQVKKLKQMPSLYAVGTMLDKMPTDNLRAAVVIESKGQGQRGQRTITFDLDEWVRWHE